MRFLRLLLLSFVLVSPVYAGDEEFTELLTRIDNDPYTDISSSDYRKMVVAKLIDNYDTLQEVSENVARCETLLHFELLVSAFMWGSVLFICYCQRS